MTKNEPCQFGSCFWKQFILVRKGFGVFANFSRRLKSQDHVLWSPSFSACLCHRPFYAFISHPRNLDWSGRVSWIWMDENPPSQFVGFIIVDPSSFPSPVRPTSTLQLQTPFLTLWNLFSFYFNTVSRSHSMSSSVSVIMERDFVIRIISTFAFVFHFRFDNRKKWRRKWKFWLRWLLNHCLGLQWVNNIPFSVVLRR